MSRRRALESGRRATLDRRSAVWLAEGVAKPAKTLQTYVVTPQLTTSRRRLPENVADPPCSAYPMAGSPP